MSYRLSGSNPVRLHLTLDDAEWLSRIVRDVDDRNDDADARRIADRLDARIEEVQNYLRRGRAA